MVFLPASKSNAKIKYRGYYLKQSLLMLEADLAIGLKEM